MLGSICAQKRRQSLGSVMTFPTHARPHGDVRCVNGVHGPVGLRLWLACVLGICKPVRAAAVCGPKVRGRVDGALVEGGKQRW